VGCRATWSGSFASTWNRGGNRDFGALDARALVPYVEAGFVAAGSQYRGGGGSEGHDTFGGDDVEDVLNLVTLLKSLPEVDAKRIGMVGYSRGGMMTYRALREDARRGLNDIRVAATVGGVADYVELDKERQDMVPVYLATVGCAPWSCPDDFVARSAMHWADEMRAPLLLLHGEADDRVPVEQSVRLAAKLREAGRPVKLVTFPGDDHGLSAHEYGLTEIFPWLGAHLGVPPETLTRDRILPLAQEVFRSWPREVDTTDGPLSTPPSP
jgi:dipeptidyl aminopeptidase/acylaminoacyl peptidase